MARCAVGGSAVGGSAVGGGAVGGGAVGKTAVASRRWSECPVYMPVIQGEMGFGITQIRPH